MKKLEDLKVGDKVIYDPANYEDKKYVKKIIRISKRMIFIEGTYRRFDRRSGRLVGNTSDWRCSKIESMENEDD